MVDNTETTRFRSFAERYLVARAPHFDPDPAKEEEQMWECLLRAKTAYRKIEGLAVSLVREKYDAEETGQI
jgi:hypothetical protein